MNKVLVIIIAIIAIAGGIWLLTAGPALSEAEQVRQALAGRGEVSCTFIEAATGETGTMQIKDGNMRVGLMAQVALAPGQEPELTEVHMILKDDIYYTWADGQTQGIRFSIQDTGQVDEIETPFQDFDDMDEAEFAREYEEHQFDCRRGGVSRQAFDLPADVEFMDIADMMQPFDQMDNFMDMDFNLEAVEGINEAEMEAMMEDMERQIQDMMQ